MDQSKINVRYAKAFFSLAKEKGITLELRKDARSINSVCATCRDFTLMLESPVIKSSQKADAVKRIFKGQVHELSLNFLQLIIENKRENYIPGIFRYLESLYRAEEGVKSAVLTSAFPLNETLTSRIQEIIEKEFNGKVELNHKTDSRLLGGFVLRVEDKQYDASLSTQLKRIKEHLLLTEMKQQ